MSQSNAHVIAHFCMMEEAVDYQLEFCFWRQEALIKLLESSDPRNPYLNYHNFNKIPILLQEKVQDLVENKADPEVIATVQRHIDIISTPRSFDSFMIENYWRHIAELEMLNGYVEELSAEHSSWMALLRSEIGL